MQQTRGFSNSYWIDEQIRAIGISDREDACVPSGLREHVFSREKLTSLSYCEGDTCLTVYDSVAEFDAALQKAKTFYEKY